ncbi:MAG: hypothetical protein OXP12_00590 [Thaumarchaeota archaeon]|nr:hypothetical protein [Nitrososphaerota archaeon]
MIEGLQIEGIDMSNPDVCKLIDAFSKRFEQVNQENAGMRKENAGLKDQVSGLKEENTELKDEVSELKAKVEELARELERITGKKSGGARRTRRYSTREIKDYPRPKEPSKKSVYAAERENHGTVFEEVDQKFCPVCGNLLAESSTYYDREKGEDVIDGRWCNVRQRIFGRYCRKCRGTRHAKSPNFLAHEQLGIAILAMISTMRHLRGTYGNIGRMFSMFYGRNLNTSRPLQSWTLARTRSAWRSETTPWGTSARWSTPRRGT